MLSVLINGENSCSVCVFYFCIFSNILDSFKATSFIIHSAYFAGDISYTSKMFMKSITGKKFIKLFYKRKLQMFMIC